MPEYIPFIQTKATWDNQATATPLADLKRLRNWLANSRPGDAFPHDGETQEEANEQVRKNEQRAADEIRRFIAEQRGSETVAEALILFNIGSKYSKLKLD